MKRQRVLLIVVSAALILVSIAFLWQWRSGTIDYWLEDTMKYQLVDGQWESVNYATNISAPGLLVPIHVRNDGLATASFDLMISFKNAIYNGSSDNQTVMVAWEKINNTAARYYFTINPHRSQEINVYFQIENQTESFIIGLTFQSHQLLQAESAQKGSQPWQTVYRTLYFERADLNSYLAAHIC
jgi:hypothetical protein